MKLTKQASYIYNILSDRQWHCPIDWGFADGHAKRLTDINNFLRDKGLMIESDWCNCGRHASKIKKRRIVPISSENPIAQKFFEDFPVIPKITVEVRKFNRLF